MKNFKKLVLVLVMSGYAHGLKCDTDSPKTLMHRFLGLFSKKQTLSTAPTTVPTTAPTTVPTTAPTTVPTTVPIAVTTQIEKASQNATNILVFLYKCLIDSTLELKQSIPAGLHIASEFATKLVQLPVDYITFTYHRPYSAFIFTGFVYYLCTKVLHAPLKSLFEQVAWWKDGNKEKMRKKK